MKTTIAALFILATLTARAQVSFSSLQDVFAYADRNAVSIRNALLQEQISKSQLDAAKTSLLPSVNATAAFNDNITLQPTLVPAALFNPSAPEGTFNEYTFGRRYVYNTGVQAGWDVFNFQRWFSIQTADAQRKMSEATTLKAKYDSYNLLAQTYYSILLTEKYISISKENVKTAGSIYEVALDKFRNGVFAEENLNRAKIQEIQARNDLRNLEYSLGQLNNQLQSQLNLPQEFRLTEQLGAGPDGPLANTKLHPDVSLQQAQLTLAEAQLRQIKAADYPAVSVGYQYNHNWAADEMFSFSGVNSLPQQFLVVKLSIPIFNGFATREKVRQAGITLKQEQALLENKKLTIAKEDESLNLLYLKAKEQLQNQEEILSLQHINDLHTSDRYQAGIISIDERLDKFGDLLSVQNRYMQSLSDYYISYYKLYIRTTTGN